MFQVNKVNQVNQVNQVSNASVISTHSIRYFSSKILNDKSLDGTGQAYFPECDTEDSLG